MRRDPSDPGWAARRARRRRNGNQSSPCLSTRVSQRSAVTPAVVPERAVAPDHVEVLPEEIRSRGIDERIVGVVQVVDDLSGRHVVVQLDHHLAAGAGNAAFGRFSTE